MEHPQPLRRGDVHMSLPHLSRHWVVGAAAAVMCALALPVHAQSRSPNIESMDIDGLRSAIRDADFRKITSVTSTDAPTPSAADQLLVRTLKKKQIGREDDKLGPFEYALALQRQFSELRASYLSVETAPFLPGHTPSPTLALAMPHVELTEDPEFNAAMQALLRTQSVPGRESQARTPSQAGRVQAGAGKPVWAGADTDWLVFAGPAVRDDVTRYRADLTGSVLTLGLHASADELHRWARRFGKKFQLSWRDGQLEGQTNLPVWLVGPQGLSPGMLTRVWSTPGHRSEDGALAAADAEANLDECAGQWMDISLAVPGHPVVWAMLLANDPTLDQGVTVKRKVGNGPAPLQDTSWLRKFSEIEVRWAHDRFPPLNVVAYQFQAGVRGADWESGDDGKPVQLPPEFSGTVWGTRVYDPRPRDAVPGQSAQQPPSQSGTLLSSAGSRGCVPR